MGILYDFILDGGIELSGAIDDQKLELLLEATTERVLLEADSQTIYIADALDLLDRHRDFEPEPSEILEHLAGEDLGDWRKVTTVASYIATRDYLGAQLATDIDTIKAAVADAQDKGFEVTAIYADCRHGWAPHSREEAWTTGTVYTWPVLDGGAGATLLRVPVGGGDSLWLELVRLQ